MPICRHCGVELESDQRKCPLCGTLVGRGSEETIENGSDADPDGIRDIDQASLEESHAAIEAHDAKVRLLFHEVVGFIALAGAVVVLATDLAYGMDISWSRIPLASIGYAWLSIFLIPRLTRTPYLLVAAESILLAGYLFALDSFTRGPSWFWGIAFPLVVSLTVLVVLGIAVIRVFKLSVLGGLAVALVQLGLATLCIEGILQLYLHDSLSFSWSMVTAAAVIPLISFLVSFDRRLKRQGSNLKKHFHV